MLPCAGNMSGQPLKILGLAGEYRATSKSGMLVNQALNIAADRGAEVVFWDLAEQPLPWSVKKGAGLIRTSKPSKHCWNPVMRFSFPLPSTTEPCRV